MNAPRVNAHSLIAPIVLLLVALFQIYRTHTQDLSPWKGGGYGMFSTIDRPSWRFLKGYLVNGTTEIVIGEYELGLTSEEFLRVQTRPVPASLNDIATELTKETWIRYDVSEIDHLPGSIPDHWKYIALDPSFMERTGLFPEIADSISLSQRPAYPQEFALLGDEDTPDSLHIPFTHVRIEAWRIRFDPSREQVHAEHLAELQIAR